MKKNEPNCTLQHFGKTKSAQTQERCSNPYKRLFLPASAAYLPGLKQQATCFFIFFGALLMIITGGFFTKVYAQQSDLTCSMNMAPMVNGTPSNVPAAFGTTVDFGATFTVTSSGGTLNPGLAVDNNLAPNSGFPLFLPEYASLVSLVGTPATLRVTDAANTYNAGNFVGFALTPNGLLGLINLSLLSNITIRTFNDGVQQESISSGSLLALGLGSDYTEVGFYTNNNFDAVEIELGGLAATINVHAAFMRGTGSCNPFVAALDCNTPTLLSFPAHPVVAQFSSSAVADLNLSDFINTGNMLDSDPETAAQIVGVDVAKTNAVSVKNTVENYPAGTHITFDVSNTAILNANILNAYSIQLYLDGTPVGAPVSGSAGLIGVDLLNTQRFKFGVVAPVAFDEARLLIGGVANVGTTNIHGVYLTKLCTFAPSCYQTYPLTNPQFPVVINPVRTGATGVLGANNKVTSPENVIDNISGNYATLSVDASVVAANRLSVWDPTHTYEAGTYVGFNIAKGDGTLLDLLDIATSTTLLSSVTIRTYNDGVETVDSKTGLANLLDLNLLGIPILGAGTTFNSIGFKTTAAFDEVVIEVSYGVNALQDIRIYSAQIVTSGTLDCPLPVDFGDISSEFKNGSLFVSWKTLSETNNKEFFIEASKDGKNWVAIGTVASKAADGNSDVTLEYNFTKSLPGLALGGLGLIALLSMPFFRNRFIKACLTLTCLVLLGLSCNKDNEQVNTDDMKNLYIRIGQVDKDGTVRYSSAVKTINRQ
jgi:hypothetical protein